MQALCDFLYCPHEGSNIGMHFYMTLIARHSLLAPLNYMCIHTPTKFPTVYWRGSESSASCCALLCDNMCKIHLLQEMFCNWGSSLQIMKSIWAECSILDSKRTSRRYESCIHVRQLQPNDSATQILKKDWILWLVTFMGARQRSRHHIHSVYWMKFISTGWICEHVWCAMRLLGPFFSKSVLSHQYVTYILTPLWNARFVYENLLLSFQQDCISSHHKQFCMLSNVLGIYCVLKNVYK